MFQSSVKYDGNLILKVMEINFIAGLFSQFHKRAFVLFFDKRILLHYRKIVLEF